MKYTVVLLFSKFSITFYYIELTNYSQNPPDGQLAEEGCF
jgi:hypothetical protein